MYLIKTMFLVVFLCFPLNSQENFKTINLNSSIFSPEPLSSPAECKALAKDYLEYCLTVKPESQWGVCEKAYYRAIKLC